MLLGRKTHLALGAVFFTLALLSVKLLQLDTLQFALDQHWQFPDLPALEHDPFHALLYQHSQPPLFSFIIWLLLKAPGALYPNFIVLNALAAAATASIIYHILCSYTRSVVLALFVALLYLMTPATLLNISYPFYPTLTAMGYALLVYAFFLADKKPSRALGILIFSVLYLSLLRSSFSVLHALFFTLLFLLVMRPSLSRTGKMLVVFLVAAIALAVPVKNQILYSFFGSSSWAPLNLSQGVGNKAALGFFPSPEIIRKTYPDMKCARAYGVVDSVLQKQNGTPNYNACYVLEYARKKQAEFWSQYRFKVHLRQITKHITQYLAPPDVYHFLKNRSAISVYADTINRLQLTVFVTPHHPIRFLLPVLLAFAVLTFWRWRDRFLGICIVVASVHFLTHNLTDGGEGKRFVFDVEFLFYLMAAISLASYKKNWIITPASAQYSRNQH